MPTADQIETDMIALRTAATQLAADGSTLDGTGQLPVHVTATSARKYLIVKYTGEGAHARMRRDMDRGVPPTVTPTVGQADGVVLVYDDAIESIVVARIRK